jgi:hypothetical protein
MSCESCGARARTHKVYFVRHIGALIVFFHKRISGSFCRDCVNKYFFDYFSATLLFGWWGPISFFLTPFVLLIDIVSYVPAVIALSMGPSARSITKIHRAAAAAPSVRPAQENRSIAVATVVRGSVVCPAAQCRKALRVAPNVHGTVKCRHCGHVFKCRNQTRMIRQAVGLIVIVFVGSLFLWLRNPPGAPQIAR